MTSSQFGDPSEDELPFQPLEQSVPSTEASNADNATSSEELFSYLVSTSTDGQPNDRAREFYQCRRCGKHFGRLDHVKRHCRSHINKRTYLCTLCSKSFNRKDLLDRHRAIHSSVRQDAEHQMKRANRTAKACAQCIISKTKCSDERPCRRCRDRGQACGPEPEESRSPPLAPATQSQSGTIAPSNVSSQWVWTHQGAENEPIAFVDLQNTEQAVRRDESPAFYSFDMSPAGAQRSTECVTVNSSAVSSIWDRNILLNESAINVEDDILMALDLDWNSLIQQDYDFDHEHPLGSSPKHSMEDNPSTSASRSRGPPVQEFFNQNLWVWNSDSRDLTAMDEAQNLPEVEERLLLSSAATEKASESKQTRSSFLVDFTCGSDVRDALLLLIERNSDFSAAIRRFPSSHVLAFLLRAFAFQETMSRCPILHLPSFNVDKCRTELLSALIVAGSANFANRQIWKLGLALHERTRLAIYKALDHNKSIAKDLETFQAQILWVEAGLWSGVRRKMEAVEAVASKIPTLIRWAGAYGLEHSEDISIPTFQDDNETLQSKWLKWTELETFKRCIFRAFVNDVQGSVAYLRSPSFYSTEISFGLPAMHDLWAARNASAWRTAYLAKTTIAELHQPTLLDIIQDPATLQSLPHMYDREVSAFTALHCLWPQIAALQDARTLHRTHRDNKRLSRNNFWLEGQRQDLCKRLMDIRDASNAIGVLTAEGQMVCELFIVALFVSFIDIEKLVGRFGLKESRATIPNLQIWSDGEESRYAMWHAGQILKAAETMKPTQLRGFYAVAVYQACLVLALPFLLRNLSPASSRDSWQPHPDARSALRSEDIFNPEQQVNLIILNGPENMHTRSFLLTGEGSPALLFGNEVRALSNVDILPMVIARIFENNYANTANHLPPMLERLVVLAKELTKLSGR